MRTRMTVPILLLVLALGLLARPGAVAGELTVERHLQGAPGEERDNDGVLKTPRSKGSLNLPNGRVRLIVQLEDPPVASYRGGIGSAGAGIKVAIVDGGLYSDNLMFDGTGFSYPTGYPLGDDWCSVDPTYCNGKIITARHINAAWFGF